MLMAIPQHIMTVGIFLGYFTCYGTVRMQSSLSWRIPYIIQVIMAMTLAMSCVFLPKSPRWLVQNGQNSKAIVIIRRFGISDEEAESKHTECGRFRRSQCLEILWGDYNLAI